MNDLSDYNIYSALMDDQSEFNLYSLLKNDQFSQPGSSTESDVSENLFPCFMPDEPCVDKIVKWISGAKEFIIVEAYSFSCIKIAHALMSAKSRGVEVKMMIDKNAESKQHSLIPQLRKHGIKIQIDEQVEGYAHNKVMIIDNDYVITGSYNWTDEKFCFNSDTIVFIKDECVNKKYRENYEHLNAPYNNSHIPGNTNHTYHNNFRQSRTNRTNRNHPYIRTADDPFGFRFGINCCSMMITNEDGFRSTKVTGRKEKSADYAAVDVCFPRFYNQDCIQKLSDYMNDATKSIFIQASCLTHLAIIKALTNAKGKGNINVKLLLDKNSFKDGEDQVRSIIKSGIEVKCDLTNYPYIAHSKTVIIDKNLTFTGSLNLSNSAQKWNRENLLFVKNIHFNKMFKKNFFKKWNHEKSITVNPNNVDFFICTVKAVMHNTLGE